MKKLTILFLAVACFMGTMNAQVEQIVNKNGVAVLPEAGQFAIGVDARPFLQYVGDFMNSTSTNTAATFNLPSGQLYGKYFLSETNAIRGRLSFSQNTIQQVNRITQDGQTQPQSIAPIEVEDERITNSFNVQLGGGMEFRRGKGRLIGVYGGEAFVGLQTSNVTNNFGNAISLDNQTPTSTAWPGTGSSRVASRTISETNANSFIAGLNGFAGVEYFFAPQISIGGEFTFGLSYTGTNRSEVVTETWDEVTQAPIEIKNVNAGTLTNFGIFTGNVGGSINLFFHF